MISSKLTDDIMPKDYSKKGLQKVSFKGEYLSYANFSGSDIRGADFTGADLTGADFSNVRTGITPFNVVLIFIIALGFSMLSGYVAMLGGQTIQGMLASKDPYIEVAGIISIVIIVLFIIYYYLKGGGKALRYLLVPVIALALVIGIIAFVSGLGSGIGMLYLILSLILVMVMFVVGTVARVAAGTLSSILFGLVALFGSMFGRSVGGGLGTVVIAISCMVISRKALSGAKGFEFLRNIALFITYKFGTSFRNTKLTNASFSGSKIYNSDFTNADIASVNWGDTVKINSITSDHVFTNISKI